MMRKYEVYLYDMPNIKIRVSANKLQKLLIKEFDLFVDVNEIKE